MKSIETAKNLVSSKKNHSILVAGDFNLPNARWLSDGSVSVSGPKMNPAELLIDLLAEYGITQFVTFLTFIQADGTCKNTLDNVISDNDMHVRNIKSSSRQFHVLIRWNFHLSIKSRSNFSSFRFNFGKGDCECMRIELNAIVWKQTFGA